MNNISESRRAFCLRGGAALGTGVAATAGASAQEGSKPLQQQLVLAEDPEAIRQLHLAC